MFPLFLLSITLAYIVVAILLYTSIGRMKDPQPVSPEEPPVSIIIPARNEAENLPGLFASLEQLRYGRDNIEIILVDDRSNDETGTLMADFCAGSASRVFVPVQNPPENDTGKNNALTVGAARATGKYLFFTDADCRVPPQWITATLARMTHETGAVAGPVIAASSRGRGTLLSRLQSLDWAIFSATGAAFSAFGRPLGMFGNNMCIRKSAYEICGGFAGTRNRITEDYALFDRIRTHTHLSIKMHLHPSGLVFTRSEPSLQQLVQQRIRWAWGLKGRTAASYVLAALPFLSLLIMLIGGIMGYRAEAGIAFLATTATDILLFSRIYRRLGIGLDRFDLLWYKPYQLLVALRAMGTYLITRTIQWKERSY